MRNPKLSLTTRNEWKSNRGYSESLPVTQHLSVLMAVILIIPDYSEGFKSFESPAEAMKIRKFSSTFNTEAPTVFRFQASRDPVL